MPTNLERIAAGSWFLTNAGFARIKFTHWRRRVRDVWDLTNTHSQYYTKNNCWVNESCFFSIIFSCSSIPSGHWIHVTSPSFGSIPFTKLGDHQRRYIFLPIVMYGDIRESRSLGRRGRGGGEGEVRLQWVYWMCRYVTFNATEPFHSPTQLSSFF